QRWVHRLPRGRVPEPGFAFPLPVPRCGQNGLAVRAESHCRYPEIIFCACVRAQLADRLARDRVQEQDLVLTTGTVVGCRQDGLPIGTEGQGIEGRSILKPKEQLPRGGIQKVQLSPWQY